MPAKKTAAPAKDDAPETEVNEDSRPLGFWIADLTGFGNLSGLTPRQLDNSTTRQL